MAALTGLNALTVWAGDRVAASLSPGAVRRFAGACFLLIGAAMLLRASGRGNCPKRAALYYI